MDFSELLLLAIFGLILLGPDEFPKVARTVGHIVRDVKKSFNEVINDANCDVNSSAAEKCAKSPTSKLPEVDGESISLAEGGKVL